MSGIAMPSWAWLTLAGLGAFHGLNPAMGWLFAVALGLYRGEQRTVLLSLVPIALGHAAAVAATLAVFVAFGLTMDAAVLSRVAAAVLIGWAVWHALRGHRRPLRVGMRTGLAGLAAWSFMMASAHGAGLMLIPVLAPLCASPALPDPAHGADPLALALAALAVHTAAMLAAIAAVSVAVYRWVDVDFLRRGWLNVDLLWTSALAVCGLVLLIG
ncbi:MAG TPA: hypothetical protein VHN20_10405 [Beijerinckiaceae bacterium]|nr:hypothetical protein [Beijerinckiaceae bacterium]